MTCWNAWWTSVWPTAATAAGLRANASARRLPATYAHGGMSAKVPQVLTPWIIVSQHWMLLNSRTQRLFGSWLLCAPSQPRYTHAAPKVWQKPAHHGRDGLWPHPNIIERQFCDLVAGRIFC